MWKFRLNLVFCQLCMKLRLVLFCPHPPAAQPQTLTSPVFGFASKQSVISCPGLPSGASEFHQKDKTARGTTSPPIKSTLVVKLWGDKSVCLLSVCYSSSFVPCVGWIPSLFDPFQAEYPELVYCQRWGSVAAKSTHLTPWSPRQWLLELFDELHFLLSCFIAAERSA